MKISEESSMAEDVPALRSPHVVEDDFGSQKAAIYIGIGLLSCPEAIVIVARDVQRGDVVCEMTFRKLSAIIESEPKRINDYLLHPSRTLRPKVLEVKEISTDLWVVCVEYKFCNRRRLVNGHLVGSVVVCSTLLGI